jgi:predicted membrane protein
MVLQLALVTALSAPFDVTDWNTRRLTTQRVGMTVLGSWAVANMAVGAVGFALETDERMRWVYLGSLLWNTVNLALAAVNLILEWKVDPASIDAKTGLSNNQKNEKIFWVNAGLDVAYLATSAFLWQRGSTTNDARMVGLGQALLVQGAFLLVFDAVMALLNGNLNDQLIAGLTFSF